MASDLPRDTYDRPVAETRRRNTAIDVVRILTIVAVVVRHDFYDPKGVVAQVICPWIIACFFMLSGYLWSSRKTLAQEVDQRFTTLLVPYAAWIIVIGVPYFGWLYATIDPIFTTQLLATTVLAPQVLFLPFSAAWFFPVMFIAVVGLRWLGRFPRAVTWAVVAVVLVATVVAEPVLRVGPFGVGIALVCMVCVVAGQELRRLRDKTNRPGAIGFLLIALGGAAVALGASRSPDGVLIEIKTADFGFPILGLLAGIVVAGGIILVAVAADAYIPERVQPAITEVASAATFVIFLHAVVFFVLKTPVTGSWPDLVVALVVPYALAIVLIRRGWLPWLTGVGLKTIPVSERLARMPVLRRLRRNRQPGHTGSIDLS